MSYELFFARTWIIFAAAAVAWTDWIAVPRDNAYYIRLLI